MIMSCGCSDASFFDFFRLPFTGMYIWAPLESEAMLDDNDENKNGKNNNNDTNGKDR